MILRRIEFRNESHDRSIRKGLALEKDGANEFTGDVPAVDLESISSVVV